MEKSTKIGLTIAILIAVVALGVVVFKDNGVPLGGNAHYQKQSFIEGFYAGTGRQFEVDRDGAITMGGTSAFTGVATFNGGVNFSSTFATSSAGTATYTAANITGISSVLHNATGALTATLPATSTLTSLVPATGDKTSITLVNIGAGTLTLAGGSGMIMSNASTSLAIPATSMAELIFVRQADTDIAVLVVPGS